MDSPNLDISVLNGGFCFPGHIPANKMSSHLNLSAGHNSFIAKNMDHRLSLEDL